VTDGADVDVRLGAVELLFGHGFGWWRWLVLRGKVVEPPSGFEPPTSSLPRTRSAD
jgi:hypothetical protein